MDSDKCIFVFLCFFLQWGWGGWGSGGCVKFFTLFYTDLSLYAEKPEGGKQVGREIPVHSLQAVQLSLDSMVTSLQTMRT